MSFLGIADRVDRIVADIDAAGEKIGRSLRDLADLRRRRRRVGARNQQALAGALLQQLDGLVDALITARQHDDGIGLGLGRGLQRWSRTLAKPQKTAEKQGDCQRRRQMPPQRMQPA